MNKTTRGERASLLRGALWGLAAVAIWGGWWVMTRLSVTESLQATDLAALRFGLAGLLMLPVAVGSRTAFLRVPPHLLFFMVLGAGVPYALVAAAGLHYTAAGNGSAFVAGFLPLAVALFSAWLFGERIGRGRAAGIAAILAGGMLIAGPGAAGSAAGPLLFFAGAAMWAGFTIAMRRSGLSAMAATAMVCVVSGALYLPVYALFLPHEALRAASFETLAVQGFYHGVLTSFGALFCFGKAILHLGAARAAVLPSLMPVAATVLGAAALQEIPSAPETAGVLLISLGAAIATALKAEPREAAVSTPAPMAAPTVRP